MPRRYLAIQHVELYALVPALSFGSGSGFVHAILSTLEGNCKTLRVFAHAKPAGMKVGLFEAGAWGCVWDVWGYVCVGGGRQRGATLVGKHYCKA